jgi:DNA-binding CsgD family transcriptional regulator
LAIVSANTPAQAFLETGTLMKISPLGKLESRSHALESWLLTIASQTRRNRLTSGVSKQVSDLGEVFTIRVHSLSPEHIDEYLPKELYGIDEPRLLMTIRASNVGQRAIDLIGEEYRLTPTEKEILSLICSGHSTREISDRRSSSLATVRNQVKSLMVKCGVNRQIELALLVGRYGS